jgi:hypothetical protein
VPDLVDCPHCIRGQRANPEVYDLLAAGIDPKEQTRKAIDDIAEERVDSIMLGRPRLVKCETCSGSGCIEKQDAATILLTEA